MENWQSEFLQFSLFIAATIWLVQKGSNESKTLGDAGLESDEQQQIGRHTPTRGPRWAKADDFRTRIYENSLLIVMTLIFFATWFGQSLNNWRVFNAEQATHDAARVSWGRYLLDPDFWEKTLQNWQSEFLAVGTMVVFTIYLRQRGSPSRSPSAHHTTRRQRRARCLPSPPGQQTTRREAPTLRPAGRNWIADGQNGEGAARPPLTGGVLKRRAYARGFAAFEVLGRGGRSSRSDRGRRCWSGAFTR